MDNFYGYPIGYQPVNQNITYPNVPTTYQRGWQNSTTALPSYTPNTQNVSGNIIWIQGGLAGAKAYSNLQPGIPVALWDSDEKVIYIKSLDQTGKPSITIIDYTERDSDDQDNKQSQVEYATKDQINELTKQFKSFGEKLNSLNKYVTKDQFDTLNGHLDDLSGQIEDIEDRITSFGKPQQNSNSNNRRGGK